METNIPYPPIILFEFLALINKDYCNELNNLKNNLLNWNLNISIQAIIPYTAVNTFKNVSKLIKVYCNELKVVDLCKNNIGLCLILAYDFTCYYVTNDFAINTM